MPPYHVSVIIPTYNRARLLWEAIASVVQQTYPVSEIVVADDGSSDETQELLAELLEQGAPIKISSGPHEGRLGPLRNRGVAASSGDLLAFLDSDDLWLPQRLEKQIAALEKMPGAGAAFCNVQQFDASGPFAAGPWLPRGADYSGRPLAALFLEPLITASSLLVLPDVFAALGGFTDGYNAVEFEFALRLAAATPISYVAEPLVLIRSHGAQVSTSTGPRPMLEHLAIVRAFLRSGPQLTPDERRKARRGMANVHYKLARYYMALGDARLARRHLLAQSRLRPWERRIWRSMLESYR